MEITGVVKFRNNGAVGLQLRPQTVPVTVTAPTALVAVQPKPDQPPTVDAVRAKILGDGWAVHPSRKPLTDSEIKIAVSNAQIQHRLQKGPKGDWVDRAWESLRIWAETPKRNRKRKNSEAAKPPLLSLPAPSVASERWSTACFLPLQILILWLVETGRARPQQRPLQLKTRLRLLAVAQRPLQLKTRLRLLGLALATAPGLTLQKARRLQKMTQITQIKSRSSNSNRERRSSNTRGTSFAQWLAPWKRTCLQLRSSPRT